jgi:L-threonylcarbamoyladenylate synthase
MSAKTPNSKNIKEAAELLRQGKLVVFPTETVYGLGADATNGKAVAGIFAAKNRPKFNPLIVHVSSIEDAETLVEMNDMAKRAALKFWPGPLTIVLPKKEDSGVSDLCSAGLPTLAVRVPANKTARSLLKEAGVPVAAPSANSSGKVSPTSPVHVQGDLGDKVDMIIADGACEVGLESTVLDLSCDAPVILRPGAITSDDLEETLGCAVAYDMDSHDKPKSPGQLLKHYAPSVPVRINAVDLEPGEALLAFGSDRFIGIKGGGSARDLPDSSRLNLSKEGDMLEAASNLFRMLRELDRPEHKAIAVMNIPDKGIGVAINDRLRRSAEN